jgi:alkaline phosphatase
MKNPVHPRRRAWICLLLFLVLLLAAGDLSPAGAVPQRLPVRNVIVMIADGSGYNHGETASDYLYGAPGGQVYAGFPVQYAMSTFLHGGSYDPALAWASFDYVASGATDSAASATAMSTGTKTNAGFLGLDPGYAPLTHLVEQAEAWGKATGVVTSVELSAATPAGFVAHNSDRTAFEEIANEMIYSSTVDVIMGAGHPCYDDDGVYNGCSNSHQYVGGAETWADLTDAGGALGADADGDGVPDAWTLVETRAAFQALAEGPAPARVIGIPQVYATLQYDRSYTRLDRGVAWPESDPYSTPLLTTVPTLAEMTLAALNVLDEDPDGFFVMIEGGAIDWASHGNSTGRLIEEQIDFDNAVEAVVDWVTANSNWSQTLLIVTADHETGYLWGPGSGQMPEGPVWNPIVNNGAGSLPGMEWHSGDHTNSLVPLFARGGTASLFAAEVVAHDGVRGDYVDNTAIARVVAAAMTPPDTYYVYLPLVCCAPPGE